MKALMKDSRFSFSYSSFPWENETLSAQPTLFGLPETARVMPTYISARRSSRGMSEQNGTVPVAVASPKPILVGRSRPLQRQ